MPTTKFHGTFQSKKKILVKQASAPRSVSYRVISKLSIAKVIAKKVTNNSTRLQLIEIIKLTHNYKEPRQILKFNISQIKEGIDYILMLANCHLRSIGR